MSPIERVMREAGVAEGERVIRHERGVNVFFRGFLQRRPCKHPEDLVPKGAWTVERNGSLVLTNQRLIYAVDRWKIIMRAVELLIDVDLASIGSCGVATGERKQFAVELTGGDWRKRRLFFDVRDPEAWRDALGEILSEAQSSSLSPPRESSDEYPR